ncbi:MAG: hypothetical protein QME51_08935, partial [Planctomycetota bacterium]|nr:hypothetical protein [Planctomycetota bacterium]
DWAEPTTINEGPEFRVRGDITVGAPNGGEKWIVDSTYNITWTLSGSIQQVNIYYDITSAFTAPVKLNLTGPYDALLLFYPWKIPNNIQPEVWVKITDANYEEGTSDISNNPFVIRGALALQLPVGGEEWTVDEKRFITWTATGTIPFVELRYSLNGGADNYPYVITPSAPSGVGTYGYEWTIPHVPLSLANQVKIKVSDARAAFKDYVYNPPLGNFKIKGAITMDSPKDKDIRLVGIEYPISWTWKGYIPNVKIEYSTDAAHNTWKPIIGSTANIGSYPWLVPGETGDLSATVKVRVSNADDTDIKGLSTGEFRIRDRFDMVYPEGSSVILVSGRVNQPITWTSVSTAGKLINVKLQWSSGGSGWETVPGADNISNNGSFLWTIPNVINSAVKVRVYSLGDPPTAGDDGASAESQPSFKIRGVLEVTNPNGNITWYVQESKTIQWNTFGPIETVKVEYSINDGVSYPYVITATRPSGYPNPTGSCPWQVPDHFTDKLRIKITDVSSYTGDTDLKISVESPAWTSGAPNKIRSRITAVGIPSEVIVDSTYNITWTRIGNLPTVKIEYSKNNFGTAGIEITPSTDGTTGSYPWGPIPNDIASGVVVRVSDTRDYLVRKDSSPFNIKGSITVGSPKTGDAWVVGTTQAITWTWTGSIGQVEIQYSTDDFTQAENIFPITTCTNTGSYGWTPIPDRIVYSPTIKVRVRNTADLLVLSKSVGFKIRGAFPTIHSPKSTDIWEAATAKTISWTTTGTI